MKVVAAILAAGQGTRFGGDKTASLLGGRPVWQWSYDTFASVPEVDAVVLVGSESNIEELRRHGSAILGGQSRQDSSRAALDFAADADILILHDAARPLVSRRLVEEVLTAAQIHGAAAAALPVTDTIKMVDDGTVKTLDRERLRAMQTPQAASVRLLQQAHAAARPGATDDMALLEAIGVNPILVTGDIDNFKITTPEDLDRARSLVQRPEFRTGIGYDIHAFSTDRTRQLWLGGVHFEGAPGLEGHSDADVLLHAVTDALLGAAALGDIGVHFPNTDPRWHGEPSLTFLRHAGTLLAEASWVISNIDATLICERPKVMGKSVEMRNNIAAALNLPIHAVSVKATTNEGLGSLGRGEGISAFATAMLTRSV
jgi:2-C-methyl-D-erythritol 4-phosphate cytidylyltransferase/2-C-methyl-D-erythritol 2,4-cyclodiphosphate synthase